MKEKIMKHYYGDSSRYLFVAAGIIMLISYPFFSTIIGLPVSFALIAVIALAVFGGILNPKQIWIIILDALIPVFALFIFEYMAVYAYSNLPMTNATNVWFFLVNQTLAIMFFIATYIGMKTLRGAWIAGKEAQNAEQPEYIQEEKRELPNE